ncbi:rRNA pseudouridine synthase [Rhodococcus sp. D2-41]|uniref:pseudouridine synthase n=1 Tax=Speluncibacter jeojiensis TaxID=2710754 RepID=UPI00240F93A0|nr:pseudouridine synthase [Rhodococcus sp. D2-41]MDG3012872.1 rRNA pseudouridine synthase [Rhodococcus sp. D2-41]
MNRPARRDGTPDRNKRQGTPARGGTAKGAPHKSRGAAGKTGAGAAGTAKGAGKPTRGKPVDGKSAGGRPTGGGKPTPKKNAAKKNAKPQRQHSAPTKLSNAKPARHQGSGPVATSFEPRAVGGHPKGEGTRLQKVLAQAGVASRRAAEELIAQGRVEVDGAIVTEQGLRIDPNTAVVRVDGTRIVIAAELVHLALNKPRGWQSTMSDDLGRPCVGDIVAERVAAGQRLFHVGRLDADTEGLLLLTNDGDLAHRLMHPSYEVSKTYLATVAGEVARGIGKQLRAGVELEDGIARADSFTVRGINEGKSLVELTLHEGRKHIVRRLLDAVGHPVIRLVRTDIGPVALGDQRPGTLRALNRAEVGGLYEQVGL